MSCESCIRPLQRLSPGRLATACRRFQITRDPGQSSRWIVRPGFRHGLEYGTTVHRWLKAHGLREPFATLADAASALRAHVLLDPPPRPPTAPLRWKRHVDGRHSADLGGYRLTPADKAGRWVVHRGDHHLFNSPVRGLRNARMYCELHYAALQRQPQLG